MADGNLLEHLPDSLSKEQFDELLKDRPVRIERILSHGQASPESGWYDQDEHEWVLLLQGRARLAIEDQQDIDLTAGDYLLIPAHTRHRVSWTDPEVITIWLAVFYSTC
ncbi:MAG: cupin domain-containing protein [Candidatus Thiodiazotropha sp.]